MKIEHKIVLNPNFLWISACFGQGGLNNVDEMIHIMKTRITNKNIGLSVPNSKNYGTKWDFMAVVGGVKIPK